MTTPEARALDYMQAVFTTHMEKGGKALTFLQVQVPLCFSRADFISPWTIILSQTSERNL
jgi:hypothetical protein